jgi:hypothetical protein
MSDPQHPPCPYCRMPIVHILWGWICVACKSTVGEPAPEPTP